MQISFNTWLYCSFPTWLPVRSLEDVIDLLAELGYDGVEVGGAAPHGYPDHLDAQRRAAVRNRLLARGLRASAICPALGGAPGYNPVSPDAPERTASIEYMTKVIELARDIECPNVIWLAGYRRYGQGRREARTLAVENLRRCAEAAERAGVHLAIEPTAQDSNMIEDACDCIELLDDAGVPRELGGVMLDTAHIFHRDDDVRAAFREAGDRLSYVHVADLDRDAPGTHSDFTSVFVELRAIGYDGWVSAEVGFNRRESDPDGLARRTIEHLRQAAAVGGSSPTEE